MKTLAVEKITRETFDAFGTFYDMNYPENELSAKGSPGFYSDLLYLDMGCFHTAAISVGREYKREKNVIEFAEFHRHTCEGIFPIDGDVIIYVALATGEKRPPFEHFHAFFIPKGYFVVLKPGVWHGCQLPCSCDMVNNLIFLPPLTYTNDTYLYSFSEREKIEII